MTHKPAPAKLGQTEKAAMRLTGQLGGASILGIALRIPLRTIVAGVLGTVGYGVLSIADLVQYYASFSDLGMRQTLVRQIPILLGRGDKEESNLLASIVLTWFILATSIAVLVLWLLYAFGFSFKGLLSLTNLIIITLILISHRFNAYFNNYAKGYGIFDAIGSNAFIQMVVGPIIMALLVIWLHVTGALLGQLCISLLIGANFLRYIVRHGAFKLRLVLPWNKLKELLGLGLLLFSNKITESLLETIGISLLAFFSVLDDVGQLGYAVTMMALGTGGVRGIAILVSRRMLQDRGLQGESIDYKHFRRYLETALIVFLLFTSGLIGVTYFSYEVVVRLFIPEFLPAILLAQIITIGYLSRSLVYFFRFYLNATDQLVKQLKLALVSLACSLVTNLVLLVLDYGAMGVAMGITVGYSTYGLLLVLSSARQIYGQLEVGIILILKLLFISLLLALCIHLLTAWQPVWFISSNQILGWISEFVIAGIRLTVYGIFSFLLYCVFFRRFRPEQKVRDVLIYLIYSIRGRLEGKRAAS